MEDLRDYWVEYALRPPDSADEPLSLQDSSQTWEEGEQEEAWLLEAGLAHLTGPWKAGRELWGAELSDALSSLPPHQVDAVRRRVDSLNHTIVRRRSRPGRSARNTPHIKDVFSSPPSHSLQASQSQHMSLPVMVSSRPPARRVFSTTASTDFPDTTARFDLFGGMQTGEVAGDTDGVLMLGYHHIGTISKPRSREKRSGSDPTSECGSLRVKGGDFDACVSVTTQESSQAFDSILPIRRASSQGHLASEEAKLDIEAEWLKWSFVISSAEEEKVVEERLGQTYFDGLGEEDRKRLRPLLLLEVTPLLDLCGAPGLKLKLNKKKRKDDLGFNSAVFGVPLATLLERDSRLPGCEDLKIPFIFQKLLQLLERESCLQEEGLLRVAGSRVRMEVAAAALQSNLYGPNREEKAIRALDALGPHDLGALLKKLLRELPQPLLTAPLLDSFYHCHSLTNPADKEKALRLLSLLLPPAERHVLQALLEFLAQVAEREMYNKMTLNNVAMIFAPNLFPPTWLQKFSPAGDQEGYLNQQVQVAAESCRLVEFMVRKRDALSSVPPSLVRQLRQQYESERYQCASQHLMENKKHMRKLLGRRPLLKESIVRVVDNEVDFQEGVLRVNAPQFRFREYPIQLVEATTAGNIILELVSEANSQPEEPPGSANQQLKLRRQDGRNRALCELAPNGNLSCLLASADSETALKTHFLYEHGGNIGQRQIPQSAKMLCVYRENPNAQWIVVCHHRNARSSLES
ncbi:rho GTPase-activating protein conundrum [Neocloeon triangulifer]|uniref:rho GTPase-activating protein conundrum n=1 Tax=Neocloeon triangulifer TaxID=2078957 RepID=UPI00286F3C55|nr:rho GTPase-activating protein conundrum [Neocloeon triangulifer]XP_059483844.1 rho GTPase-activating protein conundrum [Neocloeon triangulifer]XP_059483845.1 rho GTPase-activating protein conundrum [Neocloeon triangulifer]XP_059483846.1 rho GTPase-activating protein conundrum [Neocloeon triangulifer]XP_059483848.1 rho GTPase-activating protein conundrum [Neocloeon triangulifer]XP_059483849.1 rho GTPase-activating protein conundrum [Neocloeon triangulifer]XP_059483850.1 rho GTPase-activatin